MMKHEEQGRAAQRRRTRRAIVDAAARLLAAGQTPSVADIAAEADVSRRTVYMHFATLEQILLDATAGALTPPQVDHVVSEGSDPRARVAALIRALLAGANQTLPLGRRLIKLTVEEGTKPAGEGTRRGYRRIEWIERAVEPLRGRLSDERFERLVSALAVVIGWESMIVLRDVRGLDAAAEQDVILWMADTLVREAMEEGTS
jgi:AcrR family transcriptional regulator